MGLLFACCCCCCISCCLFGWVFRGSTTFLLCTSAKSPTFGDRNKKRVFCNNALPHPATPRTPPTTHGSFFTLSLTQTLSFPRMDRYRWLDLEATLEVVLFVYFLFRFCQESPDSKGRARNGDGGRKSDASVAQGQKVDQILTKSSRQKKEGGRANDRECD